LPRPGLPALFVTPHAIQRFRSRVPDAAILTDEQVITAIKSQLEGTGDLPVYAEMKDGALTRTYKFRWKDNIYYAVVSPRNESTGPHTEQLCVTTILDHTNRIHRIIQGRQDDRKRDPRRVSQEEHDTIVTLNEAGYNEPEICTIMKRSDNTVHAHLIKARGRRRRWHRWTNREMFKALELRKMGLTHQEIAKRMGLTYSQVHLKLLRIKWDTERHPERQYFWQVFAWCTNPMRVLKFIRDAGLIDRFREEVSRDDDDSTIPHIHITPHPPGGNADASCHSS
jgi:hypothetical protein